jgi:hypothetical protein
MDERRTVPRMRSYLGAHLVFDHRRSVLGCVVRNISATGAKVQFPDTVCLPTRLHIEITQPAATYSAEVVWRTENEIGLAFQPRALREGSNVVALDAYRRRGR